jgi:hypothetical protein
MTRGERWALSVAIREIRKSLHEVASGLPADSPVAVAYEQLWRLNCDVLSAVYDGAPEPPTFEAMMQMIREGVTPPLVLASPRT